MRFHFRETIHLKGTKVDRLEQLSKEFEEFLKANAPQVGGFHPHYQKALWEMMDAGGKRFRPMLCLCVVDSLSPAMLPNAFLPALALESLHTYSLIHDDLPCMDNSPLRRGFPTLHTTYNETLALLVGDALNTYAFELLSLSKLSPEVKVSLIYELSHNAGASGMVLGQVLDCEFENKKISFEELKIIHQNKTLKLIATSLKFGAIIANVSEEIMLKLENLGNDLGLFFQVRDDLIDVLESEEQAGKRVQNDLQKNTYVTLLGLEGAKTQARTLAENIKIALDSLPSRLRGNLSEMLKPYLKSYV